MRVARLSITRFRSIKQATILFDGHTLMVGMNNVGKSTICEALDLVLGPDRLNKFPPVEEYDFYNAEYLEADGETAIPAHVEVVLTDLTPEVERTCPTHIEFWHTKEKRLLVDGEVDQANPPLVTTCLRIETVAQYNKEDDEFEANTYFSHGTRNLDETKEPVSKKVKRLFGFLYLRALRTGARALSLERGSLLDIILRIQGIRTGLWEQSIKQLRDLEPPIAENAPELTCVLENIEKRLSQYISVASSGQATKLFVSQLTREHLRKTISFFLSTNPDQKPVPFHEVGTGTLNVLVLALLSFIAEVKKDNVIFAMEEPEIALPPHTQRRIASYLLNKTTQCFVTSHSPYVIERFNPDQILILRRSDSANISATPLLNSAIKEKLYRRHTRRGLAEAMLGQAVIVVEGYTEQVVLQAVAEKMESCSESYYPLDLSGITIFSGDGDGTMPAFGAFFKSVGLKTYAFYDQKKRSDAEQQKLKDSFDVPNEIVFKGMENLLANEVSAEKQWAFLQELQISGDEDLALPDSMPEEKIVSRQIVELLKSNKGNGYAGRLIELCEVDELPASVFRFLEKIYNAFQRPEINMSECAPTISAADAAEIEDLLS